MAFSFLDNCGFVATSTGTVDIVYSSVLTGGYQSPSAAGAVNGAIYRYRAYSTDQSQWEIGYGAYNTGTNTLSRTTVLFNSSGGTSKISFSATPNVVMGILLAEDLGSTGRVLQLNQYNSSQTITILAGATGARIRFYGATAGTAGNKSGGGNGGYLEKLLTGLTPTNTLVLTLGAAGASTPSAGGNSTLASGTQTISTLTVNGGAIATSSGNTAAPGAGGTATGGDVNITGNSGNVRYLITGCAGLGGAGTGAMGAYNAAGQPTINACGVGVNTAGQIGGMIIEWLS